MSITKTRTKKLGFFNLKSLNLNGSDRATLLILAAMSLYWFFHNLASLIIFGILSLIGLCVSHIVRAIPLLERYLATKIRFWHVATLILTFTWLGGLLAPANAIFLSGLEAFMTELASQSATGGAGGGEGVTEEVIELIFNVIRGVFLLMVAAAALFAYNQAQQGNDWRPIVTQVGLAFGIVIAIDVITYLFVGDGTGGGGGTAALYFQVWG